MSFVENEAKRRKEEEQANAGPKNKHQETLKQILADEKQSALFAEYLTMENRKDLAEAVAAGKFDEGGSDENELTLKRRKFLEIIERSDNVIESLDDQSLKGLIAASPELTKISERNGPEGIRDVIKSYLPKIAITDRGTFETLNNHITNIAKNQENGSKIDANIKEAFKDYDLNTKEIEKLLRGGEEGKAAAREIAEVIRGQMGRWKRLTGTKNEQIAEIQKKLENLASMKAGEIKDYLDKLGADRTMLGDALGLALMKNPVLHEALATNLRSETIKGPEPEASFKGAKSEYDENMKSAKAMWEKKRDAYRSGNEQDIYDYHEAEWLEAERAKGRDEYYDKMLQDGFKAHIGNLSKEQQKAFKELDDATKQDLFAEYAKEIYADTTKRNASDDAFMNTWKDPTPDATLKRKWQNMAQQAAAVEMNDDLYENLHENFVQDFTASHGKGKKGGTWTSIFGELLNKGLFDLLG